MSGTGLVSLGNTFGVYFIFSRFIPGVYSSLIFFIYFPQDVSFQGLNTGHVLLLLILGFPVGQLIYSTGALVERLAESEESHRLVFEEIVTDEFEEDGESEQSMVTVFRTRFEEAYDIDPQNLSSTEVYRMTRSAIELDKRGRSLHWDALQSFSRTVKHGSIMSAVLTATSPILAAALTPAYLPVATGMTTVQLLGLTAVFAVIALVAWKAEEFYKEGYVDYLVVDFCNLNQY